MKRTIKIKAEDKARGVEINIVAKIKTNSYLTRDEVKKVYSDLHQGLVDVFIRGKIRYTDFSLDRIRF